MSSYVVESFAILNGHCLPRVLKIRCLQDMLIKPTRVYSNISLQLKTCSIPLILFSLIHIRNNRPTPIRGSIKFLNWLNFPQFSSEIRKFRTKSYNLLNQFTSFQYTYPIIAAQKKCTSVILFKLHRHILS